MPQYETVIGLEVHVQLATESKLFCSCSTEFGKDPNENVCAICSGMPGILPVLNKKAVEYAAKLGMSLNCELNPVSIFARKNYFYPDLPKGYQLSQYDPPICGKGHLEIDVDGQAKKIGITRIHLEEDAGKTIHSQSTNQSFVDLNRGGVPLAEIVSEPDISSPEEAVAYLKALHNIALYLGVSYGNMEEGNFRCDVNVSIRPKGSGQLGTRTELKNINSFRNVLRALEYEIERHKEVLEEGGSIVQETRLYDANKNATFSMRSKEEAHDYRYCPDPDLVPVYLDDKMLAVWREELPELPADRMQRFINSWGLSFEDAAQITGERALADYYEKTLALFNDPKRLANLVLGELLRELNQQEQGWASCKITPEGMAELARMLADGEISTKIAHDIFGDLFTSGASPKQYVADKGLAQISDSGALETAVLEVIAENPDEAEAYKGGKTKLISFFVGQVMRKTKGQANPGMVNQLIQKHLG